MLTVLLPILAANETPTQESMANTDEFIGALKTSLWIIWSSYSVLGGVALLIYQQDGPVSDNIMSQLPSDSPAQEPLLLFITIATLFTYPLAMQVGFGRGSAPLAGRVVDGLFCVLIHTCKVWLRTTCCCRFPRQHLVQDGLCPNSHGSGSCCLFSSERACTGWTVLCLDSHGIKTMYPPSSCHVSNETAPIPTAVAPI